MKHILFATIWLILLPSLASADSGTDALSSDPQWLALMHVNRGATLHSRGESYVDDPDFFLHENGKTNLLAELRANIALLSQPAASERCRFPARYRFLADRLGWQEPDPLAHCDEYLAWREQVPTGRVVLVFPASYLNSPSSMFGHTLLRFDASDDPDSVWNSWAVNFGAVMSGKDNSLLYVYRGLLGGYPGHFAIVPYVTKIQEYSHLENRDMWEYSLALEPGEVDRLVTHLWELRDIRFDYYFFDENCAYRLLELIEVARPGADLLAGFRFAEVPVNTVRALHEKDMVSGQVYRPSKAVLLRRDTSRLSRPEQRLAKRLIKNPELAVEDTFLAYPPERRHLMARAAYQALRFEHRSRKRDDDAARRSLALLRILNDNPEPEPLPAPTGAPPELGHGTQMLGVGGGQQGSVDFGELEYRFTYHDLIDNQQGFLQGAQIEGLDLRLRSSESGDLRLESLDIVHIRSLAPRDSFVKPVSWFVQGAVERAMAGGRRRLVRYIEGGPGVAWRVGPALPYAFATVRLENNSAYNALLEGGAGSRLGAVFYLGGVQLDAGVEGVYFGNDEYRHTWNLDANIPLGRQDALRLEWWRDGWRGETEAGVGLMWRHYFD